MKRWAWVVAGLYLLTLVVLTLPVGLLAFVPDAKVKDVVDGYRSWQYWLWVAVMVLGQAALLVVPVRVAERRPVARRALLWPMITAGLMAGGLAVGMIYSLCELALRDHSFEGWYWWGAIVVGVIIWAAWAALFYRASAHKPAADAVAQQCQILLRGSILELLVAVPTHVVVRHREYCCAGAMTFIGLTFGISVMLFSFGPAVFFLYANRWRRLHPHVENDPSPMI